MGREGGRRRVCRRDRCKVASMQGGECVQQRRLLPAPARHLCHYENFGARGGFRIFPDDSKKSVSLRRFDKPAARQEQAQCPGCRGPSIDGAPRRRPRSGAPWTGRFTAPMTTTSETRASSSRVNEAGARSQVAERRPVCKRAARVSVTA